jgi:hypothetical protein
MQSNNFIKSFFIFLSCHFLGTPKRKDEEKDQKEKKKEKRKKRTKQNQRKRTRFLFGRDKHKPCMSLCVSTFYLSQTAVCELH